MIQSNVIHSSFKYHVKKLLFLGSSCIYPKHAPQPLKEEYLLTGQLEPTNDSYAIAKIAGIKLCQAYYMQHNCRFISAMPTNLYGPNDNYDLESSHVLPALIRKLITARDNNEDEISVWGSGKPKREFMHVDDLANAVFFLMQNYEGIDFLNVGTGTDISIKELAHLLACKIGYTGSITFDTSKPDGTPRKLMDSHNINALGWEASIDLQKGIDMILKDFEINGAPWISRT
jgi:GDP-L-fucose synthase